MKKLIYLAGLIAPGFTVKAMAQEMKIPDLNSLERWRPTYGPEDFSRRELATIELYRACSFQERSIYLWKVLSTAEAAQSQTNQIIIQSKIDQILEMPEEEQVQELIEQIRNGGVRWGSIGDPSSGCE